MRRYMLVIAAVFGLALQVHAADPTILNNEPRAELSGVAEAAAIVANWELWSGQEVSEAAARALAMDVMKGFDLAPGPDSPVTNGEAIAFALRIIGMEAEALERAEAIAAANPGFTPELWLLGYMEIAQELGMITDAELAESIGALAAPVVGEEIPSFMDFPATLEDVAFWIVTAIESEEGDAFEFGQSFQQAFGAIAWPAVSIDRVRTLEAALQAGMFEPSPMLDPLAPISRGDMAEIIANSGPVANPLTGVVRRTGTVGAISYGAVLDAADGQLSRRIYVRDGNNIDVLVTTQDLDAAVHSGGQMMGMFSLQEGDLIEYLIRPADNQVFYINVLGTDTVAAPMTGRLDNINVGDGTITVTDGTGLSLTFSVMASELGSMANQDGNQEPFVMIDLRPTFLSAAPIGQLVELSLRNNVVQRISFVGQPQLVLEERGIVIDNNPFLGYITYFNEHGQEVTRFYNEGELVVRKQPFYLTDDEVGYLSDLFANFRYNPMDSHMSEIQPGHIVFMRFDPNAPENIISISASPNYVNRHGRIISLTNNGTHHTIVVEYANGATNTFDVPNTVHLSRGGAPASWAGIQVGDQARFLLNRAILEPGYVMESVRYITMEGDGHFIRTIVRGQLESLDRAQNMLRIRNAQDLTPRGWTDHRTIAQYSVAARNIDYFLDGRQISLDHALQHLARGSAEVYIALENHFSGERVRKVSFRTGRDELLPPDTVMAANMNGFTILSNDGQIATDPGTIVRRNGRLVSPGDIQVHDFARVVLNGGSQAAVVDIFDMPSVLGAQIVTGRILSIEDNRSFTVQSMATLNGVEWDFTPIERVFTFDNNTILRSQGGFIDHDSFVTYGNPSYLNLVVNVVVNGAHAELVVVGEDFASIPWANRAIRGTVVSVDQDEVVLRNVQWQNQVTGVWNPVSTINPMANVQVGMQTINIRNNESIRLVDLQPGYNVRVMTSSLPTLPGTIPMPLEVEGFIILVEG